MPDPAAPRFSDAERTEARQVLLQGLREDLGDRGDVTSLAVLPADLTGRSVFVAREAGVVAGLPALPLLAAMQAGGVTVEFHAADGPVAAGQPLATAAGRVRYLLGMERLALNLLSHLSGVATRTALFVREAAGTKALICDTRKTVPGLRRLAKYAVRVGGGHNHRLGLFDWVLIKDNHLAALATTPAAAGDPVGYAVRAARAAVPAGTTVQVEVDSLAQLGPALAARPDIVLLDNMPNDVLREAVRLRDETASGVLLEASGGVRLATVRGIAETGVDRISAGELTHSVTALDVGLDWPAPG